VLAAALLLAGAAVAAAALAAGRHLLRRRLRLLAGLALAQGLGTPPEAGARPRPGRADLRRLLRRTGGPLLRGGLRRWAEGCLRGTGLPLRPEEFLGLQAGGLGAAALLATLVPASAFARLCLVALGGAAVPLYARAARQRRLRAISEQLADVLSALGSGLRAGHSLLQALGNVAEQTPPPLGAEFGRLLREVGAGIPMEEALQRLLQRTAHPDLELLVTALLVQREVGGNLAEVLDKIAGTIRARLAVQRQLRVLTAQSRLSGWVVGLLPIAVFAVTTVLAPEVERTLTRDPAGRAVAATAALLELGGVLALRSIASVRY
jgi:tight adherence protein B